MNKKALSLAMLLLGIALVTLSVSQVNQMSISQTQSELAKPVAEAQIAASEQLAKSYGQSDADIQKTSQEARDLIEKSIVATNNSYMMAALLDGILGLILLFGGILTYPKEH